MWKVVRQFDGTLFHKNGTRRNLEELFRLDNELQNENKVEEYYSQELEKSHLKSRPFFCSTEHLLRRKECRCNNLTFDYSVETVESIFIENTLNDTLNSLVLDVDDRDINGTVLSTVFATSTPMDNRKFVPRFQQDEQLDDMKITESKVQVKPPSSDVDSGIGDSLETITSANSDLVDNEDYTQETLLGFTSRSGENTDECSSNNEDNDQPTRSTHENQVNTENNYVAIIPIYSYKDTGLWYWSESDPESQESVSTKSGNGSRKAEDLSLDDAFVLKTLDPKYANGRRKKKKKVLLVSSDKSGDDDDQEIAVFNRRKKYIKVVRTCPHRKGKRVSHLEDRLCTKEEKKKRARVRKKDMRVLRQRFCKIEKFWTSY